jgi:hypothetical protein
MAHSLFHHGNHTFFLLINALFLVLIASDRRFAIFFQTQCSMTQTDEDTKKVTSATAKKIMDVLRSQIPRFFPSPIPFYILSRTCRFPQRFMLVSYTIQFGKQKFAVNSYFVLEHRHGAQGVHVDVLCAETEIPKEKLRCANIVSC